MPLPKSKTKAGRLIEELVERGAAELGKATSDIRSMTEEDVEELKKGEYGWLPAIIARAGETGGKALGKATSNIGAGKKKRKK